ncbi:MAG: mechanosensitive ion channel family protein [Endomicrobiia bacterium]|nr:MAG: mechanosensitive ion channel family protein [Endomicrobiia bacterium]
MILSLFNRTFSENFTSWIRSIVLFVMVSSVGFILRKYVTKTVKNIFSKVGFVLSSEIVVISKNYISFWFFLIALYIAFLIAPLNNTNTIIHRLFYGLFVFSVVTFVASILSKLLSRSIPEKIGINIIKFAIIIVGLALILNQFGVKLTPFLATLGFTSFPVALALQDTLANFFAGMSIIASKQIVMGDYIRIDLTGVEGTIVEINWRTTLIREISNSIVSIPNSKLLSSIVTSFHFNNSGIVALIKCGVAYGSDLEHVERIAILAIQEIMNKYDDSVKTFTPIVQFTDFADFSINFTLIFKVKSVYKKSFMQSEALKNLYKKFNDEGIEIPYPRRVVTLNSK